MNNKFDIRKEIDKYISHITSDIVSIKTKNKVKQEYAEHIEDSVFRYQLSGLDERSAFYQVCKDMGDVSKMRVLLADIHNNKLQMFFVYKIWHKIREYFNSKRFLKHFLIASIVFIVLGIMFIAYSDWILDYAARLILLFNDYEFTMRILWGIIIFIGAVASIFLCKLFVYYICYLFGRLKCYFSLWCISLLHRHKLVLTRLPFSSLFGMSKNGDIQITIGNNKYIVHFIDVVFRYRREVTVLDDDCYAVSKAVPSELRTIGATLVDGESWFELYRTAVKSYATDSKKLKRFPVLEKDDKNIHVIIIHSDPIKKSLVTKNQVKDLCDGECIGGYINYSFKAFVRLLKRS